MGLFFSLWLMVCIEVRVLCSLVMVGLIFVMFWVLLLSVVWFCWISFLICWLLVVSECMVCCRLFMVLLLCVVSNWLVDCIVRLVWCVVVVSFCMVVLMLLCWLVKVLVSCFRCVRVWFRWCVFFGVRNCLVLSSILLMLESRFLLLDSSVDSGEGEVMMIGLLLFLDCS